MNEYMPPPPPTDPDVACFNRCRSGYVRNGEIEDGMMTGWDRCPVCNGRGRVSIDRLDAEITRLIELRRLTSEPA